MGKKKRENEANILGFIDQQLHLDRELELLADLCKAAQELESISSLSVHQIGLYIQSYLDRKGIQQSYFLKYGDMPQVDSASLSAELTRLQELYPK